MKEESALLAAIRESRIATLRARSMVRFAAGGIYRKRVTMDGFESCQEWSPRAAVRHRPGPKGEAAGAVESIEGWLFKFQ